MGRPDSNENRATIIYTAIYGSYDKLREVPLPIFEQGQRDNVDFVCLTDDSSLRSTTWDVVYRPSSCGDSQLAAKLPKIMPHVAFPSYEQSIWIDGSATIRNRLWKLFEVLRHDFAVAEHRSRNCVYQEIDACIKQRKDCCDKLTAIAAHMLYDLNYPPNSGLWQCGLIARRNTSDVRSLCSAWWNATAEFTVRDQITLPIVLRSHGLEINTLSQTQLNWCVRFGSHHAENTTATVGAVS